MKTIEINGRKVKVSNRTQMVYNVWINEGEISYVYCGSGYMERKSGNLNKLKRGKHHCKELQEAYNRVGKADFEIVELFDENVNSDFVRECEDENIKHLNQLDAVIVCNKRIARNGCTSKAYNKYKKLTEDKVRQIKILLKEHKEQHEGKVEYRYYTELAKEFDCSENTIGKIARGERWTSVEI